VGVKRKTRDGQAPARKEETTHYTEMRLGRINHVFIKVLQDFKGEKKKDAAAVVIVPAPKVGRSGRVRLIA